MHTGARGGPAGYRDYERFQRQLKKRSEAAEDWRRARGSNNDEGASLEQITSGCVLVQSLLLTRRT
jgi:hypothetical protein